MRVISPSAPARRGITLLGLRDVLMSADEQAETVTAVRPEGRANLMNI